MYNDDKLSEEIAARMSPVTKGPVPKGKILTESPSKAHMLGKRKRTHQMDTIYASLIENLLQEVDENSKKVLTHATPVENRCETQKESEIDEKGGLNPENIPAHLENCQLQGPVALKKSPES